MTKKQVLAVLIDTTFRVAGGKATAILADNIMTIRFQILDAQPVSRFAYRRYEDSKIEGHSFERRRKASRARFSNQYDEGLITDGERYNKVVDIWAQTGDR